MDKEIFNTANLITFCRVLMSAVLFFLSPISVPFGVIYLLCGFSDIADGIVARKTHTNSKTGAKTDSIADLIFLVVCSLKILPLIKFKIWIWAWISAIALIKAVGIALHFKVKHEFVLPHSIANKITGILLFVLPLTVPFTAINFFSVVIVCAVATFAAIWDILLIKKESENDIINNLIHKKCSLQ